MDQAQLAPVLRDLEPLSRRFTDAGHRLYLVGGVVRDLVLGRRDPGDDIDLTTDAPPATIRSLVAPVATALWTQGERFGTIGARVSGRAVEITTHRAESYATGSRKPEVRFGTDLTLDLSRRDFTINAMALELPGGSLVDPFGGRQDLAARRLRTPLDPAVSFNDDPLRMLRAARFVARFDLAPDPALVEVAAASADRLEIVSAERVHDELERLLATERPRPGLELLVATGLLGRILPELDRAGAPLDPRFGDRPRLTVALAALDRAPTVRARRALLLWPVAEAGGGEAVRAATARLRYPVAERAASAALAAALVQALADPGPPAPLVRRAWLALAGAAGDLWGALAALAPEVAAPPLAERVREVLAVRAELEARGERERLVPPLDGRAVMDHLGCGPGPVVGEALAALRAATVEQGPLERGEALARLERWWHQRSAPGAPGDGSAPGGA